MSYILVRKFISASLWYLKCPFSMKAKGYTVHNTANDAPADNEAKYMENNPKSTSFHVVIDDKKAIEVIPTNRNAFHAGDGKYGTGNRKTIGVEICYSKSGGKRFEQAEINAAEYIAKGLHERGWSIKKVYRHKDWSGKYCPHRTMDLGWKRFKNMIQAELDVLNGKENAKGAKAVYEKLVLDGDWGKATTRITQKVLGTEMDGYVSNQPMSNKKYLPNAKTVSWRFKEKDYKGGSAMVKAIQKLVGAKVDGYFGKGTVMKAQQHLKRLCFYNGKINGKLNKATVIAWQKYMNSKL